MFLYNTHNYNYQYYHIPLGIPLGIPVANTGGLILRHISTILQAPRLGDGHHFQARHRCRLHVHGLGDRPLTWESLFLGC